MKTMKVRLGALALAILMLAAQSTKATIIIASSVSAPPSASGSAAAHTIDSSGLSDTLTDANFSTVTHAIGFDPSIQYLSGLNATSADFEFTFSAPVTLDQMLVWNYTQNNATDRGVSTWAIQIDTGSGFGSTIASGTFPVINYSNHVAEIITFSSQLTNVQKLRFQALTPQGSPFAVGLDEVVFRSVPTPEPSNLIMLLFGSIGLRWLQRKRT